MLEELM